MAKIIKNKTPQSKKKRKKNPWIWRFVSLFWLVFLVGVLTVAGILYGTSQGMLGELPNIIELENPEINVASEIISSDGKVLEKFEKEKTIPITYEDLPRNLIEALYAREDVRFDEHSGIDGEAVLRSIAFGGKEGGGSTLTQQLAKQLFTKKASKNIIERIKQKLKEWVVAVQLEKRYTKEEIITMYLNKFDFVYRASGIQAAARTYFQKDVSDLSVDESAILVSMLKNPNFYNPKDHPKRAEHERNVVMSQMVKYGFIEKEVYDAVKNEPIQINFKMLDRSVKESFSAYFKYALRKELQEYFTNYKKENDIEYDLYRDGLKIYTSIDSRMQRMGEDAIKDHLKSLQKQFFSVQSGRAARPFYNITMAERDKILTDAMHRTPMYKNMKKKGMSEDSIRLVFETPRESVEYFDWDGIKKEQNKSWMDSIIYHKHIIQAGLMATDPKDGTIRTWVGGIDWDYFKYDHVKQSKRQVGSTFKPLVYATAIHQMNYTPCHRISNRPFVMGSWKPSNGGYPYTESLELRKALAHSVNMVTVRLIAESGPLAVIQLARDLGITSPIQEDLTIALGSASLSLYEMVGAYGAFANKGIYIQPEMILTVEDKNGKIIKDFNPVTREVFNPDVAYTMIDLMKGVVDIGTGRGVRSRGITNEVAGKTGTTDEGSDSWFIGVVPNLVTGVWVGNEDRAAHFPGWQSQGAKMALPIWVNFMKSVYKNGKELGVQKSDEFEKPEGIDDRWDCSNLQGFYNFGNIGEVRDSNTRVRRTRETSVNDILSRDNDTISFE